MDNVVEFKRKRDTLERTYRVHYLGVDDKLLQVEVTGIQASYGLYLTIIEGDADAEDAAPLVSIPHARVVMVELVSGHAKTSSVN